MSCAIVMAAILLLRRAGQRGLAIIVCVDSFVVHDETVIGKIEAVRFCVLGIVEHIFFWIERERGREKREIVFNGVSE